MNAFKTSLLFVYILLAASCAQKTAPPATAMCTIEYKMDGMVCTSCEQAISSTMKRAAGAEVLSISHETGIMRVVTDTLDPKLADAEQKLARIGYTVVSRKAVTAADTLNVPVQSR